MPMQVNVRLDEADWEQLVEAMPGLSNGERMARLVRQQLTSLEARHDLTRALELVETALDPILQSLRRLRLQGQGSEIAEELAQGVIEQAALLLAHTDSLATAPEKHLADLEAKLVRRWSRTTLHLLRTASQDSSHIRNHQAVLPEIQRVLTQARTSSAPSAAGPAAPSVPTSTSNQG
jgi:hypothetical protein